MMVWFYSNRANHSQGRFQFPRPISPSLLVSACIRFRLRHNLFQPQQGVLIRVHCNKSPVRLNHFQYRNFRSNPFRSNPYFDIYRIFVVLVWRGFPSHLQSVSRLFWCGRHLLIGFGLLWWCMRTHTPTKKHIMFCWCLRVIYINGFGTGVPS